MHIIENFSLKSHHTFGMNIKAKYFVDIQTDDMLDSLLSSSLFQTEKHLILGGGSNILFLQDFDGLVIHINTKGHKVIREDEAHVYVQASAGEIWQDFVMDCIRHNFYGLENLAAIPGTVGASPVQNIGAYGVEAKDVIFEVEAIHKETKQTHIFSNSDCCFAYRESIFKTRLQNLFIVKNVTYKLSKNPLLHVEYAAVQQALTERNINHPTHLDIAGVVKEIRQQKLPDPKEIGSAGSFFKNPVVTAEDFSRLQQQYPCIVNYPQSNGVKLSAGWMIEQCGLKGYRQGDAGVYEKQALVLVNHGQANASEMIALVKKIQSEVENKFDVKLEPEVIFI